MPESYNTLAGLVQLNDKNLAALNVTDLLDEAPLLKVLFAQVASNGTLHKYLKQTTASSAGFRAALDAVAKTASADTLVTDTLAILDASFDTDVALADAYKGGRDAWLQLELMRSLKQAFFTAEKQVIYGVGNDAVGFAGLHDNAQLDAIADAMVIECATPGASVSSQTSVYILRSGKDDCSFIMGNEGKIVVEDEPTVIAKAGAVLTTSYYPALYVPVTGYCGFQIGGAYSAARICNIETALTDDDIYNGLSLFPSGRQPNLIVMNRTALKLLRESRTATNPSGDPAPRPTSVDGIPIVCTDAVVSTEAVET
ncbi:MAG: major capsid protein [Phycisphaerae bacterium]|jgi:hypothetical protein